MTVKQNQQILEPPATGVVVDTLLGCIKYGIINTKMLISYMDIWICMTVYKYVCVCVCGCVCVHTFIYDIYKYSYCLLGDVYGRIQFLWFWLLNMVNGSSHELFVQRQ